MSVPVTIAEVARAAARPARTVSGEAAVTAGAEAALAADRRYRSRQLLARLSDLPVTVSSHRELSFPSSAHRQEHDSRQEWTSHDI
jgi:hypothetical protein